MSSVTLESQPAGPDQVAEMQGEPRAKKKIKRVGIPRRDRPTRGRVIEALLVGVLTQTAIAMLWIVSDLVERSLYSLIFVFGIAAAAAAAQRRLEGMARLVWSLVGAFWASLAFWVVSVPVTLRSNPGYRGMSYPLFMARDGWYSASDLLPVVLTALTVGVVVGVAGWIVWSWKASRELRADIYTASTAPVEPLTQRGSEPMTPPVLPAVGGQLKYKSVPQPSGESDNSRDRWGPPTEQDSSA